MVQFELPSINERKQEFIQYKGKEVGLNSDKGIIYGVIESEDRNNIYLNPHLAYNPIPLGKEMLSNAEKRNFTRIVPKTLLTKLVQEYNSGYLDEFVNATNQKDEFLKIEFEKNTTIPFNYAHEQKLPEKRPLKERITMAYNIAIGKLRF